jgi:hypothetical protein
VEGGPDKGSRFTRWWGQRGVRRKGVAVRLGAAAVITTCCRAEPPLSLRRAGDDAAAATGIRGCNNKN